MSRCGTGCGTADLAKGYCSTKLKDYFKLCSNSCDIYAKMALCYAGEELVSVSDISEDKDRQRWACQWSL